MKVIIKRAVEGLSTPELGNPTSAVPSSMVVPLARASTGSATLSKYELERSPNGTTGWTIIASGPLIFGNPPTQFNDGSTVGGTTYFYRCRAFSTGGIVTPYSAVKSGTTATGSTGVWTQFSTSGLMAIPGGAGRAMRSGFSFRPTSGGATRWYLADTSTSPISQVGGGAGILYQEIGRAHV